MITLSVEELKTQLRRRKLRKIYYGHYDYERGTNAFYPVIRIGGKYLAEYGFSIGDAIEVEIQHGRITITKTTRENVKE